MNNDAQENKWLYPLYWTRFYNASLKQQLKIINANEQMKDGYAVMAQINLEISEFGLVDYISAISIFEKHLDGEDN